MKTTADDRETSVGPLCYRNLTSHHYGFIVRIGNELGHNHHLYWRCNSVRIFASPRIVLVALNRSTKIGAYLYMIAAMEICFLPNIAVPTGNNGTFTIAA
jgi:hypothetical protein